MSKDKNTLPTSAAVLNGAVGKTLSNVRYYKHGSTQVVEINWSDSSQSFIKLLQGQAEIGGTNEWGTGTQL